MTSLTNLDDLDYLAELDFLEGTEKLEKKENWDHSRIDWNLHVQKLVHEKQFAQEYRIEYDNFNLLCYIMRPVLELHHAKSRASERITVEITVGTGIRFLAGGKASDKKHIFGLSRAAVYCCIHDFLKAVNSAPELRIELLQTADNWEKTRSGFTQRSHNELFHGCVGVMDGFFQPTISPTKKESNGNVKFFYSGHYESYGLNCQGACDADLRYLYFGVVGPGKTNDNVAFPRYTELYQTVMDLPLGLYFLGDAAYDLSETLLVPFTGSQRANADNDAYNFYLSQLRIRIEMSFGRLVRKWSILKTKLECRLSTSSKILMACDRLHNYVIDCQLSKRANGEAVTEDMCIDDEHDYLRCTQFEGAPLGLQYLPILPDEEFVIVPRMSMTRMAIIEEISKQNYRRPLTNLVRNSNIRDEFSNCYITPRDVAGNEIEAEFFSPT